MTNKTYKYVDYLWDDAVADKLDALGRLRYRSNILGADQRITNTGGGNTSSKVTEPDPVTGEQVDVMWVKGSGGDLRTSKRENFASLYMDKFLALQGVWNSAEDNTPKSPMEDNMVAMYRHCVYNLNPRASSIDTPLHGLIPYKHVDHMHPISSIAIAACKDQVQLTKDVFGGDIGYVGWQRPGYDLGVVMGDMATDNPQYKGLIMGQHGIINWDNDDKACYQLTLDLIEKGAIYIAERDKGADTFGGQKYQSLPEGEGSGLLVKLLPTLRGMVSQLNRFIGTVHVTDSVLEFVNSHDALRLAEIGTSCPDHFLRTKIKPLFVDWNPQSENYEQLIAKLEAGLAQYREDYAAYYEACKHPDSPAMRDPNPTVILIPGVGMITWGKNKSESRVSAEFYSLAIKVMRAAEAISEYQGLPRQEAFDIEYWALEEAKLQRQPPAKELARNVVVVVGAGSGIGKATAQRVAEEGAHVVCVDLNAAAAQATADALTSKYGLGVGVAGTGISGCAAAIGLSADITDRASVQAMFAEVIMAYGGIDNVIVTAGVFVPPSKAGKLTDAQWDFTFGVNVKGLYIIADEARAIWEAQGLTGSLVLTTSVNAVVSKRGSIAYDTSKAAANHLVREMAVTLAPLVRVNGLAPATVVEGSSMFPRDRVIASLTKYSIAHDEADSTEQLRDQLAGFYAQRTLTKAPITLADQAEVAYLLASTKLAKTTGQIISVDGGLHEAFLR